MHTPIRIAVTGAAGQIGYNMVFRIASGAMFGAQRHVILQLLEIPSALGALEGVAMELHDCAFPLLDDIEISDNPDKAFNGASCALLVGSRPRTKGMERKDLISANGAIFTTQGKSLNDHAADDIRVLVVGNPANTNCLIAASSAPDIPKSRFTAMTRLDHNRALAQLSLRTGVPVSGIQRMTIWGNHSATQYPDVSHCYVTDKSGNVTDKSALEVLSENTPDIQAWLDNEFIPTVQQRGAAVIEARGASSAASAASAAIDHTRDWAHETPEGDWVSMAVPSDGSYGVPQGVVCSFPCTTKLGEYSIVQDLEMSKSGQAYFDKSVAELVEEREAVADLGLLPK